MSTQQILYLSDLDGTLLDERGTLSERSREGLCALLKSGVQFTVASARSYYSIQQILGDLPLSLPIIEFNGAFITDYQTGEHLETNALDSSLAFELFDRIVATGERPFVCSFNGEEDCLHYDELVNAGMIWYEKRRRKARDPRLRCTSDLRSTMTEDVVSLTVMAQSKSKITALNESLQGEYGDALQRYCYENEYSKGTWWLTIHDKNASKHIAMRSLRDRFTQQSTITAFGDNVNDIEMLRASDRAIAVENAVEQLFSVADDVIGHHRDNCVIQFLEAEALK